MFPQLMKLQNSCIKINHQPNGRVIRVPAEGAFLLSSPVVLLFPLSPCVPVPSWCSLWTGQQHVSVSLPQLRVQPWREDEDERQREGDGCQEAAAGRRRSGTHPCCSPWPCLSLSAGCFCILMITGMQVQKLHPIYWN